MASPSKGRVLKKADPSTIHNKFLVGYQGWFTCPGDGTPLDPNHHGWLHWFNYPIPDGGRPNTDLWPDVSEYSPSELFPAPGLKLANGEQAFLFSSRNARTVERHFHWMALHGVDGAFLQRFLGQCDLEQGNQPIRDQRDEVGDHVRRAAEMEGRTYAIMYDVSGVAPDRIERVLKHDWIHLIRTKGVLDSPSYLREKGKAVVTLWGFGMNDNGHDPDMVRRVTKFIRENTPGGAYIMGGSPAYWRTSESDADRNPEWVNVWLEEFDAISPWTIGRYHDLEGVDRHAEWNVKGDLELINKRNEEAAQGHTGRRHVDYIPVVFPGGSGYNLSEGKWSWNDAPRHGGRFLWRELWNLRRQGVRTMYGAMWDEYDEGTAFLPIVAKKHQLPVHDKYSFMALDEDGFDLPPDWYMRIAGFAAESLRGERFIQESFPSKELQDYWSTRPHYEEKPEKEGASSSGGGQSWEEWQKLEKEKDELPPPPPYTLEADDIQAQAAPNISPATPSETRPVTQSGETCPVPVPFETRPAPSTAAPAGTHSVPAPIRMDTRPISPTSSSFGASNADLHRSPSKPAVPLTSRPSISYHAPSSSVPGQGQPAPSVPISSRPQAPQHQTQDSINSLTEDMRRQNLSSSSDTVGQPGTFSRRPSQGAHSSRPVSPLSRPGTTSADHAAPYQSPQGPPPGNPYHDQASSFTPPSGPPPSKPYGDSSFTPPAGPPPGHPSYGQGSSSFPAPGVPSSNAPSSPTGPWSQSAWPPPEWGVKPASPTFPSQPSFPNADYGGPNYRPTYPTYPSSYGPSHTPSPPRPSSPYGNPGGFQFPQADVPSTYGSYAAPPQPHAAPQPYGTSSYGSGPSFPTANSNQYNAPYAVYQPHSRPGGSSPPLSGQYQPPSGPPPSTYPGGPNQSPSSGMYPPPPTHPGSSTSPGPPPHPPPRPASSSYSRPPGAGYGPGPTSTSPRPPGASSGGGGMLNGVVGSLGALPGGGKIQGLAQTGEKLFSKFTGRK